MLKAEYHSRQLLLALSLSLLVLGNSPFAQANTPTYKVSASIHREFQAADQDLQTGKYQNAETRFLTLLKKDPNNKAARSAMAMAQAELFKLDAAEKNARTVLAKDPNNAMAHVALGVVSRNKTASQDMAYRNQHDTYLNESAKDLEQATRLAPRSAEAHNELGVTYRFQGRLDDAQREFEKAASLDPTFAEALVNQGITLQDRGDTSGAKQIYSQAIRLNSKNYMAHYRLGEALLNEGDSHQALQSLNTALALNPNNAAIMTKMAEAYEQQGNVAAAVSGFRKAMQSNPSFMPAYVGISNLYDGRGDGELAMAELKSGLNVNPKYNPARNQLGRLALSVDKPDQAMRYYKEALQQNPKDPEALQGLSQALMTVAQKDTTASQATGNESDLVTAEQNVQEALRLNPNDMRLHLASLRISQLAGKPSASTDELNRIISTPSHNDSDQMVKGEALLSLGRYQDADGLFNHMMQKSSNDPDKLLVIGDTLKANGNLLGARQAYKMVLATEPTNLKAERGIQRIEAAEADSQKSLRLAHALNNWRQKESSIDYYEETLSKDPRQPEARLALAKLYEKYKKYDKAISSYQFYLGLVPNLDPGEQQHIQKKIEKLQAISLKNTQDNTLVQSSNQ